MNIFNLVSPVYAVADITIKPAAGSFGDVLGKLTVGGIIGTAFNLVIIITSLVFFFILVIGGLKWITSGGDEKAVGVARAQITNALIGLAIVFAAWAIMALIGKVFGLDFTNITIPVIPAI